ncbi:MAG: conjugal transfer protein TraF [Rickettsiaceae bacterium]|nr:conjugal transfer protein TraF [Rickettsiaceae bacterium]
MLKPLTIAVFMLLMVQQIYALEDSSFANGWYWGKDEEVSHKNRGQAINTKKILKPSISHAEILKEISTQVEELKAKALIEPTIDNVSNYIRAQNKVVNMASKFSVGWQKAMLEHPELNFTVSNPTNNYAKQIIEKENKNTVNSSLEKFSKLYGLLFFYAGKKSIDTFQNKIVREFASSNNVAVIAIAVDKTPNQYFPNSSPDNGRAKKLGITVTPALIALNVQNKETQPLAFGVASESEIEIQIDKLIRGLL